MPPTNNIPSANDPAALRQAVLDHMHVGMTNHTILAEEGGPLLMESADGIYVTDIEGNRYIDFVGGIGVLNTGHRHPKVVEAAKAQGLDPATARQMVLQTAWGAAQLAIASEAGPDVLRQQVTSPGGTTAAALNVFEEAGFREQVQAAVAAARERSEELAG